MYAERTIVARTKPRVLLSGATGARKPSDAGKARIQPDGDAGGAGDPGFAGGGRDSTLEPPGGAHAASGCNGNTHADRRAAGGVSISRMAAMRAAENWRRRPRRAWASAAPGAITTCWTCGRLMATPAAGYEVRAIADLEGAQAGDDECRIFSLDSTGNRSSRKRRRRRQQRRLLAVGCWERGRHRPRRGQDALVPRGDALRCQGGCRRRGQDALVPRGERPRARPQSEEAVRLWIRMWRSTKKTPTVIAASAMLKAGKAQPR